MLPSLPYRKSCFPGSEAGVAEEEARASSRTHAAGHRRDRTSKPPPPYVHQTNNKTLLLKNIYKSAQLSICAFFIFRAVSNEKRGKGHEKGEGKKKRTKKEKTSANVIFGFRMQKTYLQGLEFSVLVFKKIIINDIGLIKVNFFSCSGSVTFIELANNSKIK